MTTTPSIKTTIVYLNDASGTIQYTDKNGNVIQTTPHDTGYGMVSQRLSVINETNYDNQIARNNYERAVMNIQQSIDAGKITLEQATAELPPPPACVFWADDPTEDQSTQPWNPPLLQLKPLVVAPITQPSTPVHAAAGTTVSAAPSAGLLTALSILGTVGPALPDIIKLLQALLVHHTDTPTTGTN